MKYSRFYRDLNILSSFLACGTHKNGHWAGFGTQAVVGLPLAKTPTDQTGGNLQQNRWGGDGAGGNGTIRDPCWRRESQNCYLFRDYMLPTLRALKCTFFWEIMATVNSN